MRIGIDTSRATVAQPTGTERYSLEVVRAMLEEAPDQPFTLYFNQAPPEGLLPRTPGSVWRTLPARRFWTHGRLSREMLSHAPDVLFVPSHVVPLVHPRATVVTVHDLGYRIAAEGHSRRRRLELDLTTRFSCWASRRVIVPSHSTARDLRRHYGVPAGRIRVVHHGVDASLAPVRDPARLAEVRRRYGLAGDYLISVGTLQPRKNLVRLAEAFRQARGRSGSNAVLLLAGQPGWQFETMRPRLDELESEGVLKRVGYVPRADLAALLSGALAFALPSLYEGFGMPMLEAMACGAPLLASDRASLPEVVGDAGLLVDPYDVRGMSNALVQLLVDGELRASLSEAGLARVRGFTWSRSARETLAVLRETAVLEFDRHGPPSPVSS